MDIGSILKSIGGSLLKNAMPPLSGMAFDIINDALPSGKKLSDTSTGLDAEKAIKALPPNQRASILEKKLDVEIEEIKAHVGVIEALGEVDKTGNTTRPAIAKGMAQLIAFGVIVTLSPIAYAIVIGEPKMILSISQMWPVIATAIGIPAGIVNSYFGKRTKEKAQKYEAVSGMPQTAGLISQIVGMFKK